MSEAVTVPCLMMMTSIVSEESLVREMHIHTHIHMHARIHTETWVVYVKICKVVNDFANKTTEPITNQSTKNKSLAFIYPLHQKYQNMQSIV